jgi:hypothetical protein
MRLAGRVLENTGSLDGWSVVFRGPDGCHQVVASSADLEALATPFMPIRTPAEAARLRRFFETLRAIGFRQPNEETDERVY